MISRGESDLDREEYPHKAFFDKEKAIERWKILSKEILILQQKRQEYEDVPADPQLTPFLYSIGYKLCDWLVDAFIYKDVEIDVE